MTTPAVRDTTRRDAVRVIRDALDIVSNPDTYTENTYAEDAAGNETETHEPNVVRTCAIGGVEHAIYRSWREAHPEAPTGVLFEDWYRGEIAQTTNPDQPHDPNPFIQIYWRAMRVLNQTAKDMFGKRTVEDVSIQQSQEDVVAVFKEALKRARRSARVKKDD